MLEILTKFFIRLKDMLVPLCKEYNIVSVIETASMGVVHQKLQFYMAPAYKSTCICSMAWVILVLRNAMVCV